jgi:hypothetical protein
MRNRVIAANAAAWLVGAATFAVSGQASAQALACPGSAAGFPANTVFVSGSSAIKPVLLAVGSVLGGSFNIAYLSPGSCQGLQTVMENTKDTDASVLYIQGSASSPCTISGNSMTIDIALSDVYPSTCKATFDPNLPDITTGGMYGDFLGPIQAMTFAGPQASSQNIISAEAAYMVFGFGAATAANSITPWVTPADIFVRKYDSGTLEMIGQAIGLPGSKWVNAGATPAAPNQQASGTGPMQTKLEGPTAEPDLSATIGILSTSGLVANKIKGLAFQGKGQTCSYYPDSSSSAADKVNVRQGRYEIWGPEHLVANVDGSGKPVGQNNNTAAVQTLINALISTSQALAATSDAGAGDASVTTLGETEVGNIIKGISASSAGFIPQCAMEVSRTAEIGAEASYAPPVACSCAYEFAATGGAVSGHACTPCTAANAATTCTGATPACHFGYCEAE